MSDDEDIDMGVDGPMTVEVKTQPRPSSRYSLNRNHADDSEEEDYADDWSEEENRELASPQSDRRSHRTPRSAHRKNGQRKMNMAPPDKKLQMAEKKATRFQNNGKKDKAIRELTKCIALNRILYGSDHWKLARAHADLGQAYLELKEFAMQAEYHTELAKSIMLNSVPSYTTEQEKADIYDVLFNIYYIQGQAKTSLKKYNEADQMLAKADKVCGVLSKISCMKEDELDDYDIKLARATARLAWKQKKHAVAESQYDKLLKLTEQRYGPDSLELVPIYQEYGQYIEQSKGRYANHEKAIDMFLQAHSIAGANYREGHNAELVDTALTLAQAYSSTGSEDGEVSAEKYLNECERSCMNAYGPKHKKTLEVQDELARLYIRTDRNQEALKMLRSSLPSKTEVFGDYSEQVSDTHKLMASVYLSQSDVPRSLKEYKKCHNIECQVLGKNHKKSKDTERTIDILLATPGISKDFVLSKEEELKKRPKFNAIVKPSKLGDLNT